MLPPTPLSLLCAILLCLPLAVIFTFTAPSSSTTATSPLPLITTPPSSISTTITGLHTSSPAPRKTLLQPKINTTTTTPQTPPPPPPTPLPQSEDEADDQSLFNLASRVDPTPKPVKKLVLMFLTTAPLPFAPLWEFFLAGASASRYNIYVHADPSGNYTMPFSGIFSDRVIPSSKPTRRHTPSLISAARRLLAHALLDDESNAMFALLSPSCIPIHSFNYTYRILMKSRRSFIEILKNEPGAYERWAARGEEAMVPEVEYKDFRIGSQFWVVKRKHAKVIVGERKVWSKFKLPCKRDDTCYPEEHYFPTLLSMVDPRGCTACTLTHVDWKGSHGGHPRMYLDSEVGAELIRALRNARPRYGDDERSPTHSPSNSSLRRRTHDDPFLFARKFSPSSLQRLLDIANDVIFKD